MRTSITLSRLLLGSIPIIGVACGGSPSARLDSRSTPPAGVQERRPDRIERLRERAREGLLLYLEYHGNAPKHERSVVYATREAANQDGHVGRLIRINKEQADRVIAALDRVMFIGESIATPPGLPEAPREPYYELRLIVGDDVYYSIELMDRRFLDRLDAIEAAVGPGDDFQPVLGRIASEVSQEIKRLYY